MLTLITRHKKTLLLSLSLLVAMTNIKAATFKKGDICTVVAGPFEHVNKDENIKIIGSCSEIFNISGTDEITEKQLKVKEIYDYLLILCSLKEEPNPFLIIFSFFVNSGDINAIKALIPQHLKGIFYCGKNTSTGKLYCLHPSWLKLIENKK